MKIRIATRASKLALAQTHLIVEMLKKHKHGLKIEIIEVATKGDIDQDTAFNKMQGYGFFTNQVEQALLKNEADIAVHSFKDMPTVLTPGLRIAAIPERIWPEDVIVFKKSNVESLNDLKKNAKIGTSSFRRTALLKYFRTDFEIIPLRGNIDTRIEKLMNGEMDAIVLANAGLKRANLDSYLNCVLEPKIFIPAPAQGALAVQVREFDTDILSLVQKIDHLETRITVSAERMVLAMLKPGCHSPVGVYASIDHGYIKINAFVATINGEEFILETEKKKALEAESAAVELAHKLIERGAMRILEANNES